MELQELKDAGLAPSWLNRSAFKTLQGGYMLDGETPRDMYSRLSRSAAGHLYESGSFDFREMEERFFDIMWKGWLCPASPVLSNLGTSRGLPISCFGQAVDDDLQSIYDSYTESAMLTKNGGGIGKYWGLLRQKGDVIGQNGTSDGIIPWLKVEEAMLHSTSQGGVRRGSGASYLPMESRDIDEFMEIRKTGGDITRRCTTKSFHHGVCISDDFMNKCKDGDKRSLELWEKLLTIRSEVSEPFIAWTDTANRNAPQMYRDKNLKILAPQLCTEIFLHSNPEHTYVCCLSSMNFAKWDEWKDTNAVRTAMWFLDGVMQEFIARTELKPGFEKARRFAVKSRAVGLGGLGWHSLLQLKMLPFDSFQSMQLNAEIWKHLDDESLKASVELAKEFGEPEWCKGYGLRFTHRLAQAPTKTNSLISGGVSEGVGPIIGNVYVDKGAKGTFIRGSKSLENLLEAKGKNNNDVWDAINANEGSVADLKFLSDSEKEVFRTAREINQFAIVRQASQRQRFIDQGQSINLFVTSPKNPDDQKMKEKFSRMIHKLHYDAWKGGLKSLYYLFNTSGLRGDSAYDDTCKSCEG